MKKKNPHAVALGRIGGKVVTPAKRKANAERKKKYWDEVRKGLRPKPKMGRPKKKGTK